MVVRMRATKSHRNNRRSHHKLAQPALATCPNCNAPHVRHRLCRECGMYRGRVIIAKKPTAPVAAPRKAVKKAPAKKKTVAKKKAAK